MDSDFKYDILRMYFCEDYWASDKIVIHQPTIQNIIDYGEAEFWAIVSTLCANPTSMRLELWNKGVDWNDLTDFDLFVMISGGLSRENTEILFGDLDFTKFKPIKNDEGNTILIYMPDPSIQIDEEVYTRIVGYLRTMFDIHPKTEKAKGKATKEAIIWEDEMNLKTALAKQEKNKWKKSTLFPLISAMVNHPGFKYKKNELRDIGIVEFMDSVKRLQIYENTTSFITGMYMGLIDTKSIDLKKELNWTRDLYED